jgi:hypothetical protein
MLSSSTDLGLGLGSVALVIGLVLYHGDLGPIVACGLPRAMLEDPIRIWQFWDKNPLVRPWMEPFLPENPMFQDCFVTVISLFVITGIVIAITYLLFLPQNGLTGIIGVMPAGFLFGSFNNRMSRARRKFAKAVRDDGGNREI